MEIHCPKCGSTQVHANKKGYSIKKGVLGAIMTGGLGLIAGLHNSNKIVLTCLSCGHTFNPGDSSDDVASIMANYKPTTYHTTTVKSKKIKCTTQKVRIATLLQYSSVINDSKVAYLEDLEKEGIFYVSIPAGELEILQRLIKDESNTVKRMFKIDAIE
jgi:hypothetical protein